MIKYSPFYLAILCVFGSIIQYIFYNVPYIFLIDYIPIIFVVLILFVINIKKRDKFVPMPIIFWTWIFFITINLLYSIININNIITPLIGGYSYLIFLIFWYEYLCIYNNYFNIKKYFYFLMVITFIVSLLGIYQYYVDMSLFGYASHINPIYALDQYYNYSEIRVTSIFTSIQVLSCFVILSIILLLDNNRIIPRIYLSILIPVVLFVSLLTGSKIVLLSIILYLFYHFILKNRKLKISRLIVIILATISIFAILLFIYKLDLNFTDSKSPILRVIKPIYNIHELIIEETAYENSRVSIYRRILDENKNFLVGNGLGTSNSIAVKDRKPLESFLLQILQETGIIGVITFICMLIMFYRRKMIVVNHKGMSLVLILLMTINQAFDSVVFFPFVGFLLCPIICGKDTLISEKLQDEEELKGVKENT